MARIYINEAACGEHVFVPCKQNEEDRGAEKIREEDGRGFGGVHKAGRTVFSARKQQLTRCVTSRFAWVGVPTLDVARYPTRPGNAPFYYAAPLHPLYPSPFSSSPLFLFLPPLLRYSHSLSISVFYSTRVAFSSLSLSFISSRRPRSILRIVFLSFVAGVIILSITALSFFIFFFVSFRVSSPFFFLSSRTHGDRRLTFITRLFHPPYFRTFIPCSQFSRDLFISPRLHHPLSLSFSLSFVYLSSVFILFVFLCSFSLCTCHRLSHSLSVIFLLIARFTLPSRRAASVTSCPRFNPRVGRSSGPLELTLAGAPKPNNPFLRMLYASTGLGRVHCLDMRSSTLLPRATNRSLSYPRSPEMIFIRCSSFSGLPWVTTLALQLKFHDDRSIIFFFYTCM